MSLNNNNHRHIIAIIITPITLFWIATSWLLLHLFVFMTQCLYVLQVCDQMFHNSEIFWPPKVR